MNGLKCKAWVFVCAVLATLLAAPVAMAGGPPTMPAVTFPVDTASIATAIGVAGGTILLAVFGVVIGFSLVKKLFFRVKAAI